MGDVKIFIIEAKELIAADRNGKSDPFVTVEVLEDPIQGKQKTKVHHKVS
jgi:Ca2+-dependent lipid-binding protein